ncbi:MAG: dicarboxylate/amino acid:cation symporter, partial [Nitrosomonas sp.]
MNKLSLNNQILLGALSGVPLGLWFAMLGQESEISQGGLYAAKLTGTLFTDLLRMVLIPLVFTSIVVGVANLRSHQQMNRVWQVT